MTMLKVLIADMSTRKRRKKNDKYISFVDIAAKTVFI